MARPAGLCQMAVGSSATATQAPPRPTARAPAQTRRQGAPPRPAPRPAPPAVVGHAQVLDALLTEKAVCRLLALPVGIPVAQSRAAGDGQPTGDQERAPPCELFQNRATAK